MKCQNRNCGKDFSDEFSFCPHCATPAAKNAKICANPDCGFVLDVEMPPDFKFCPECGLEFDRNAPPEPAEDSVSNYPSVGSVINVANIDWRVLTVENNKALLISEKILELRSYHDVNENITWESCALREYLNNEFYNSLGAAKSAIAETRNSNPDNPYHGTAGGNATTDKVFLLSLDEVCRYFGDSTANLNKKIGTWAMFWTVFFIDDKNNSARIANYGNEGALRWWLRSPGSIRSYADYVNDDGRVNADGLEVHHDSGGVRPALWLNL